MSLSSLSSLMSSFSISLAASSFLKFMIASKTCDKSSPWSVTQFGAAAPLLLQRIPAPPQHPASPQETQPMCPQSSQVCQTAEFLQSNKSGQSEEIFHHHARNRSAEQEALAKEEPRGTHLEDGVKDELAEGPGQFLSIRAGGRFAELASSRVKVPVERRKSDKCPCSGQLRTNSLFCLLRAEPRAAEEEPFPAFPLFQLSSTLQNVINSCETRHNHTLPPFTHPQCQAAAMQS